jgi:pyridoxine 5-phosphate synthase
MERPWPRRGRSAPTASSSTPSPTRAPTARRQQPGSLAGFAAAARAAQGEGLGINAGHDLSLDNLGDFIAAVPGVLEVSIGHALIADALALGMAGAVRAYLDAMARRTAR